jgi:hypothetical protein
VAPEREDPYLESAKPGSPSPHPRQRPPGHDPGADLADSRQRASTSSRTDQGAADRDGPRLPGRHVAKAPPAFCAPDSAARSPGRTIGLSTPTEAFVQPIRKAPLSLPAPETTSSKSRPIHPIPLRCDLAAS